MILSLKKNENFFTINDEVFYDLTLGIYKKNNVNCYYLNNPEFEYFESTEFIGNIKKGGSVNCEKISYYPHASGTHTECALHIADVDFTMLEIDIPLLQLCLLISISPLQNESDFIIDKSVINHIENKELATAILIRTIPNFNSKVNMNYSNTNPPFFTIDALFYLKSLGFKHLLTDLPSIDKESDGGLLVAHKAWFLTDGIAQKDRTITEFIFVDNQIKDNLFLLNIQTPKIETDEVSSKVIIYQLI